MKDKSEYMRYLIFLLLLSFGFSNSMLAQDPGLFNPRSPIDHAMILSGSFGELRTNHFHSGIDIKSSKWNKAGDEIHSVEKGHISRIKVSGDGYGNAIYIDHPGGYTSVYGHLHKFSSAIDAYIKTKQYELKSFAVDLYPDSVQFKLEKGEIIGNMGNTGRSFAPHLHFEIRHTKSEKPVNPLRFLSGPSDTRSPILNSIKIVHMKPDSTIVDQDEFETNYIKQGVYRLKKDTLDINAWRVGVEMSGFDRMDGAANKTGIYELTLKLNDKAVFQYKIDCFSFDESKHLNAHINYPDFHNRKKRFQRCYPVSDNPLGIYSERIQSNAIIPLYAEKAQKIEIIAKDFHDNSSNIIFWLKRSKKMKPPPPLHFNYTLTGKQAHLVRLDSNILYFSDSSLYQKSYIHLSTGDHIDPPLASKQIFINTQKNIFKNPIDLYLFKNHIPDSLLKKAVIVECTADELVSYGGFIFEDFITTKIDKFGNYAIYIDTVPPDISVDYFSADMRNKDHISFLITDDIKSAGQANEIKYDAYIDNKWVLFEYDAKSKKISYQFDKNLINGNHQLRIELTDDRNNKTIFEKKFKL